MELELGSKSGYRNNVVAGNASSVEVSGGIDAGGNVCDGSLNCAGL